MGLEPLFHVLMEHVLGAYLKSRPFDCDLVDPVSIFLDQESELVVILWVICKSVA